MVSWENWYRSTTYIVVGNLSSYDPGVMEGVARVRGMSLEGYKGGMSSISCGDLGKNAWINLPGSDEWIGPFLVIDCSGRNHMFVTALVHNIVGEVSYEVALEILDGALTRPGVAVSYGGIGVGDPSTRIKNYERF